MLYRPGAFIESLRRGSVDVRVNHRRDVNIARQSDRSFAIYELHDRLVFWCHVREQRAVDLLRGRPLRGASVGATVQDAQLVNGVLVIERADLKEVSIIVGNYEPRFPFTHVWIL